MQVSVTLPSGTLELAGGYGVSSETSGFSIETEGNHQKSDIIGVAEARQFFRGGSLTSVRFQSRNTFLNLALAEEYLMNLPGEVIDQEGVEATITTSVSDQVDISGTLSPDATGTLYAGLWPFANTNAFRNYRSIAEFSSSLPEVTLEATGSPGFYQWTLVFNDAGPGGLWQSALVPDLEISSIGVMTPLVGTGNATVTDTSAPSTLDLYDVSAVIQATHNGATVDLSCVLTGRITDPTP